MNVAIKKVPLYVIALILLVFTGYPFLYMISTSLKSRTQFFEKPYSLFSSFTLENFKSVFEMGLSRYFFNSILVSVIAVFAVMLIAALASYPLSRMKFKLNRVVFLLFIAGMMLPIHATLIPVFKLSQSMGLYDTVWALLGPYIAFSLPISIFILTQFMQEIPASLEEAAKIDGCSHFGIFWRVILPMLTPALMTVLIYNFIHLWNEFIFALVLISSPENMTLPLGLQDFKGEFSVNIPGLMAALTLASLPILVVYIFSQEKVVKGLAGGAVKE
ncbi:MULTISPECIES: carbohydrate ABC transporter permease [Fictibacillus]|uniref:ABC transporter permease n=1 Tax=Fictibacillus enclensis TaxID=1017270 RepID=A0A0V8J011_9BACL|nr:MULTISPECIES: carbohydrate ABC transporter permease [Fictibacillus]KSU80385.1 ABC transporter permease [Fictibacillus enclensis]RXZ01601.1 carbohydrate ABC transporter permease [Fictibacillus sp. S7]WHY71880.1 carbohydrate ABC transporter permease [Fictibacillus enclensis]SCC38736.1 raffinose/stachyose/melibiose transport system permease protein [Fictibacillus enclensis]